MPARGPATAARTLLLTTRSCALDRGVDPQRHLAGALFLETYIGSRATYVAFLAMRDSSQPRHAPAATLEPSQEDVDAAAQCAAPGPHPMPRREHWYPADAGPGWLLSRAADATPRNPAGPLCLSGNQTPHPEWRCTGCLSAAVNRHGQRHWDRLQETVWGGARTAPQPRPRYSPSCPAS